MIETDEILERIRSRGNWLVRIRPSTYDATRLVSLPDLERAVRDSSVALRGWSYPQYDEPTRLAGYVEETTDWQHEIEVWRAFQSGQFVSLNGLSEDWRDNSEIWPAPKGWRAGQLPRGEDAIFRLAEIFEFAARWSTAVAFRGPVVVDCSLRELQGRGVGLSPNRGPWQLKRTCIASQWSWSRSYDLPNLLAGTWELAIEPAMSLFELCGWDLSRDVIRSILDELGS